MTKNILMAVTGALALFAAAPAFAQTTTNVPVGVNLTIGSACVINGGGAGTFINFGNVPDPFNFVGSSLNGSNQSSDGGRPLSITCSASTSAATFEIDAGLNDSTGIHRLNNSGNFAQYRVYSDITQTPASEYLISAPQPLNGTGVITANTPFSVLLYARILRAEITQARAGLYADTLSGVLKF